MSWLSCLSNGVADTEADRRFNELVNANASQWISLAHQIANDAHYAEDAVVEALAALSAALASNDPPRDPAAWMKAAIANRARNRIRSVNRAQHAGIQRDVTYTSSLAGAKKKFPEKRGEGIE